jgi:hypothetical protein
VDESNRALILKISRNIFLIVMIFLLLSLLAYWIIYFKTKKTICLNETQLEKGQLISLYNGKTIDIIDKGSNYTIYLTSKNNDINQTYIIIKNKIIDLSIPLQPGEKKIINITDESYYFIQLKGYYEGKYDFILKKSSKPENNKSEETQEIVVINNTKKVIENNSEEEHFFENFEQVY